LRSGYQTNYFPLRGFMVKSGEKKKVVILEFLVEDE
jgi:hypothetical protein